MPRVDILYAYAARMARSLRPPQKREPKPDRCRFSDGAATPAQNETSAG